ncbi:MAG: asparagine synthase (glutamine-hydrolyzing) [Planctomycetota bacterium]|jgi:asparagine synthase (glutamine-hydrolysing)
MCGLTGFLSLNSNGQPPRLRDESWTILERMTATLKHRGPEDSDVWLAESGAVALGHRRLAILDTSPLGHQPMTSPCGRFVIIYNGEIYNHLSLRPELESHGVAFRGHSDTETLIAAISVWGVRATVERCNGMFAFAVWDKRERTLTLTRDRLGIKPLYYGVTRGDGDARTLLFGSELKPLRQHPDFDATIDRTAVQLLMQHCYIPAPRSIYAGIRKLPAGSLLTVPIDHTNGDLPEPVRWWDIRDVADLQRSAVFSGSQEDAINRLEELLSDAVGARMLSDVPLGAFLSGGIDSSLVVALMQKQSSQPVQTFSIGFDEEQYNEATHAKAVASHLGTQHTELYVTPQQARDVIPQLPTMFDEPFADSSQIPTYLVSQLARQHVTVSLSGDGGDELFGGYNRYFHLLSRWRMINRVLLRRLAATGCNTVGAMLPRGRWRDRFQYRAHLLGTRNAAELYQHGNLHWPRHSPVVLDASLPDSLYWQQDAWLPSDEPIEQWMWLDAATYLPDDILTKVDRASMAVSLEARVPLLDHRVFEFAWSLPLNRKVAGGEGKLPLREVLSRHVPRELFERPKMGFGVPIDAWLRGPLRDWAEALLGEDRLRREGIFDPAPIRHKWSEHVSGQTDWHYHLWDVLMFQSWQEAQA